jgi:hypothetical protein
MAGAKLKSPNISKTFCQIFENAQPIRWPFDEPRQFEERLIATVKQTSSRHSVFIQLRSAHHIRWKALAFLFAKRMLMQKMNSDSYFLAHISICKFMNGVLTYLRPKFCCS